MDRVVVVNSVLHDDAAGCSALPTCQNIGEFQVKLTRRLNVHRDAVSPHKTCRIGFRYMNRDVGAVYCAPAVLEIGIKFATLSDFRRDWI